MRYLRYLYRAPRGIYYRGHHRPHELYPVTDPEPNRIYLTLMATTEPPTWGAKLVQLARRVWHTYCQQQEEILLARYGYLIRFKDKEN